MKSYSESVTCKCGSLLLIENNDVFFMVEKLPYVNDQGRRKRYRVEQKTYWISCQNCKYWQKVNHYLLSISAKEKAKKHPPDPVCVSCGVQAGFIECGKLGDNVWYHKECYPKLAAERDKQ